MSGAKQTAKKVVSAVKRAWSNKVLAKVGRRAATPAEPAEGAFQASGAYEGPQVKIGPLPKKPKVAFSNTNKAEQFSKLLETVSNKQSDEIAAVARDFVAPMVEDDAAMMALTSSVTKRQIAAEMTFKGEAKTGDDLVQAKNNMFRSNTDWSRLGVAYIKLDEQGKAYLQQCGDTMRTQLKAFKGSAEIRPSAMKIEKDPSNRSVDDTITPDIAEEFEKRAANVSRMMLHVLDTIMASEIPKPLALTVGTTVLTAREVELDDIQIRKMVGAFVVLRVVNPALVDVVARPDKTGWTVSPDQNRMVINITKALQNMANGVSGTSKEPFLKTLMDALQSRADAMDDWFDRIADDGVALVRTLADNGNEDDEGSSSGSGTEEVDPADPRNKGKAKAT